MNDYLTFIVLGLAVGSVYVALAEGLLLTYRALGVVNFSQAALGLLGGSVYARLRTTGDLVLPVGTWHIGGPLSTAPALVITIVFAAVVGQVCYWLVFRFLRRVPALAQVVASIALLVTVEALVQVRFGENAQDAPPILPSSTVSIGSLHLNLGDLLLGGIALVLALLVWLMLRRTTMGIAIRGSASNENAIALAGHSPDLLGSVAMTLANVVVVVFVCMAAPATGLDPATFSLYIVPALAVLLFARMGSVWAAAGAGLVLGAVQSVISFDESKSWWPSWAQSGVGDVLPFLVIVVVLYVLGKRLPARGRLTVGRLPEVRLPKLTVYRVGAACLIGLALLFLTNGTYRFGLITSLCLSLLALSYVVITGYLGQISLAQMAFAGAAGFSLSKLGDRSGLPFPLTMLIAAVLGAVLGVIMAIPALRIRGTQLAIVTLAGGVAIEDFVFNNASLTQSGSNVVPSPSLAGLSLSVRQGSDIARIQFGLLVLVVVAVISIAVARLAAGQTGRSWLAIRANERSAAASGINVERTKVIGFAISGFIAALGGCLISYSRGEMSSTSFTIDVGLQILAVAYVGGISSISGAYIAGLLGPLGIVYVWLNSEINFGQYYQLVAGLGLLLAALLNPEGISGKSIAQWQGIRRRLQRSRMPVEKPDAGQADVPLEVSKHV